MKNATIIGIMLMLGFATIAPIMDSAMKEISASISVIQIVWLRFFMHFIIMLPIASITDYQSLVKPNNLFFQLLRSTLLMFATISFVGAIQVMEIPDVIAIVFIAPFIATAFSAFFLKEQVGIRRWSAVIVGFIGVLIITRPGLSSFNIGVFYALLCGLAYGSLMTITKFMSSNEKNITTLTYTPLIGLLVSSIILLYDGDLFFNIGKIWPFIILIGIAGTTSQYCFIRAFQYGKTSIIAPFFYFEIVATSMLSYFWFNYFPDSLTWLGITIIILSGIFISWRETKLKEKA